jgi:hypothetical protein
VKIFGIKEPPGPGIWKKTIGFKEPLVLGISKASKSCQVSRKNRPKTQRGFGWIFEKKFQKDLRTVDLYDARVFDILITMCSYNNPDS